MNDEIVYKLFSDCIPVKGFTRSLILDLTRKDYHFVPSELCKRLLISSILPTEKFTKQYLDFLIEKELVFECSLSNLNLYPPLNKEWFYPAEISNAILSVANVLDLESSIHQLLDLGCRHYMLFINPPLDLPTVVQLLKKYDCSKILTLELYIQYTPEMSEEILAEMMKNNNRISYILCYYARSSKIISKRNTRGNICYYKKGIKFLNSVLSPELFTINMPFYTESLKYNVFYNRKVCIDQYGNIKNYLSHNKIFGNIHSDNISDIISRKDFQRLWTINKDKLDICMDCEFRYMCLDSREPISNKGGGYHFSKKETCPYNPYICLWEGQEGYVPVEECGTYSRETGFVPDKKKIKVLNKKIWGEE